MIAAVAAFVVLTTVGTLASTQAPVPDSASCPGVAGAVQFLQTRVWVAGMSLIGNVGATSQDEASLIDAPVTFAAEPPDFVRVKVMANVCPALSVGGVVAMLVAFTCAPDATWTATVAGPAVSVAPVLASCQAAEPPRVSVCGVEGAVHPDQVRLSVAPMPFTGIGGAVPQVVPVSDTPVTLAAAEPDLVRVRVTVNPCPALRLAGAVVRVVAATTAGVCTTTAAEAVFEVTTSEGLFASVPDADADRVRVPAVAEEQLG